MKRVLGSEELGAAFYSFYSAITHGTQYGLVQSFARDDIDPIRKIVPVKVEAIDVIQAVGACIIATSIAFETERALKGWQWPDWEKSTTRALGIIAQLASHGD